MAQFDPCSQPNLVGKGLIVVVYQCATVMCVCENTENLFFGLLSFSARFILINFITSSMAQRRYVVMQFFLLLKNNG